MSYVRYAAGAAGTSQGARTGPFGYGKAKLNINKRGSSHHDNTTLLDSASLLDFFTKTKVTHALVAKKVIFHF